jgi:cell division protein FtsB
VADRRRAAGKTKPRQPRRAPATRNPSATALRRRRRIIVRVLLGGMLLVALLFVFVFPARTLLAQRQQTEEQRQTLALLREQSRKLEEESRRLQDEVEVERMAREQYGLVYPGERPYVVVPPPTSPPPASSPPAPSTTTPATTKPKP